MSIITHVTADLTAEDTYTDPIIPVTSNDYRIKSVGTLNISIRGTWAGILAFQRKFADETTWYTVELFYGNIETRAIISEKDVSYRLGFLTGNYTSGTADVRLSC